MKVLVTGANGYIGSKIVKRLCELDIEVIAADFQNTHIDKRAKFMQADIFESNINWFSYFENPDICLHLAWRDGFIHNSDKHLEDLSFHYQFLTNLINNGLKRIACMGTMHEIGYYEGMVDENTPCNPASMYGIAKNALRAALQIYCAKTECQFQWLRAFYIFGDDSFGNSVFCKIRQAASQGIEKFPFTTGKNKYDFIFIDDLVEKISFSILQDKVLGIINICSGKPVSLAEQMEWYIAHNKLLIQLDYGKYPDRPYDSPCIYGDDTKIKKIMEGKSWQNF